MSPPKSACSSAGETDWAGSNAPDAVIRPNAVVLKSLGKNFGLHGIRFGYLVANPGLAGKMRKTLPKWNLNSLAETVVFMLRDHTEAYRASLARLSMDRYRMAMELGTTVTLLQQGVRVLQAVASRFGHDFSQVRVLDYSCADEIVAKLTTQTNGALEVTDGTLYPVLYRLERAGFVAVRWDTPERGVPRKYTRERACHIRNGLRDDEACV